MSAAMPAAGQLAAAERALQGLSIHQLMRLPGLWGTTTTLLDARTGWYSRTASDCLNAAIATVLQLPLAGMEREDLSRRDLAADLEEATCSGWRRLEEWAAAHSLRFVLHHGRPVDAEWWVGMAPGGHDWAAGPPHAAVMRRGEIVFDPFRPAAERSRSCARAILADPGWSLIRRGVQPELRQSIDFWARATWQTWQADDIEIGITFEPAGPKQIGLVTATGLSRGTEAAAAMRSALTASSSED